MSPPPINEDFLRRLRERRDTRIAAGEGGAAQPVAPSERPIAEAKPSGVVEPSEAPDANGPVEVTLGSTHVAVGEDPEGRSEKSWVEHGPAFGDIDPVTKTTLSMLHDWPEIGLSHLAAALAAQLTDEVGGKAASRALAVLRQFLGDVPRPARSKYEPWRINKTKEDGVDRPTIASLLNAIDPGRRRWEVAVAAAQGSYEAPASSWRLGRLGPPLDEPQRERVLRAFARETPHRWLHVSDYELWAQQYVTLPDHPEIRVPKTAEPFGPWAAALESIDEHDRVSPQAQRTRSDMPARRAPAKAPRVDVSGWSYADVKRGLLEVCAKLKARGLPVTQVNYIAVMREMVAADSESTQTRYPGIDVVLKFIASPFASALVEVGLGPQDGVPVARAHHHETDDDKLAAAAIEMFKIGGPGLSVNRYVDLRSDAIAEAAEQGKILTIPSEGTLCLRFGRRPGERSRSWPRARDYLVQWAAERDIDLTPSVSDDMSAPERRAA